MILRSTLGALAFVLTLAHDGNRPIAEVRPGIVDLERAAGPKAVLGPALESADAPPAQGEDPGDPIVVDIDGPCELTLNGKAVECSGVSYMAFPGNHRINFTATTADAGFAFSGDDDDDEDGDYTLALDSVLSPAAGRLAAQGECSMDVAEDRRTVNSITCVAATTSGEIRLTASGVVSDDDDGDDDDATTG